MQSLKSISCLGYSIYPGETLPQNLISNKTIINTINPHCYCEAKRDNAYRQVLQKSDILLPDGIGIVWAAKLLNGDKIKRFAGFDLHTQLMEKLNSTGGRVFYMGSTPYTLEKIKARLKNEYPNISMGYYSPPFKDEFSDEENELILKSINQFQPDILFIGMTAPKQEKWAYNNKHEINVKIIASIGAVFDFYAGTIKRSGNIWISLGLEWLPRLFREPRRLWRRNFISTPTFIMDVVTEKIKISFRR